MSRASNEVGPGPGARGSTCLPLTGSGAPRGAGSRVWAGTGSQSHVSGRRGWRGLQAQTEWGWERGWGSGGGSQRPRKQGQRLEPTRAGPGLASSRVGGLERQSPARLSSLGDLGLTKPRGEWGAGRRWTLRLMFRWGPHSPTLCWSQPPGRCSDSLLHKDWGAAVTPKSETTRPLPILQGHRERPVLCGSRSLSFPAGEARDQVFYPLYGARLKSSSFTLLNSGVARLREARPAEMSRPCAHRAATGLGPGPVLPPCTSTPPTLSTSRAQRALAPPGSLSHFGGLAPACGALSSLPPCSPVPALGYLLRDPGQRDRDRSGRAVAPHSVDFAIRGWGSGEV